MEDKGGVVLDDGDVVASECCHMGTHWQTQEIISRPTLLSIRQERANH